MMKNKKAFFGVFGIIWAVLVLIILILLVVFSVKIAGAVALTIGFLKEYGLWVLIGITLIVFWKQLRTIANFLLNKMGIKI